MELVALSLETGERFKFCTHHGGGGPNGGGPGGAAGASGAGVTVVVDVGVEDFPQPAAKTATAKANTIEDDRRLIK